MAISILVFFREGWFFLLLWPSACFAALGWIYFRNRPELLGKREDGSPHWTVRLLFLPYVAYVRFVFLLKLAFLKESAWDEIVEGLFLGRLPTADSLPESVDLIVDLSAELLVSPKVREEHRYLFRPILNRWIPPFEEYKETIEFIVNFPGTSYVHCSAGKGRSALIVAGVLLRRGFVESAEEAELFMKRRRPQVALHRAQLGLVNQYRSALEGLEVGGSPP